MNVGTTIKSDVAATLLDHQYPVTFTRPLASGSYDVDTGTVTGSTPDSETVYGVFTNRRTNRGVDGSLSINTRVFLMNPDGISKEPRDGDELTKDGTTAKISGVRKVQSGSIVVLYVCEVDS